LIARRAAKTEAHLAGKSLRGLHSDLQTVFGLLAEDYPVEGDGAEYKRAVISGIFFKFYSRCVCSQCGVCAVCAK
jgi:hypothetical protein